MTPQWAWATHQPLLQAVMSVCKPSYVLEIGIGKYSTYNFLDNATEYEGIEQDADWINTMITAYPFLNIAHHELKGVTANTRYNDLTSQQKYETVAFYNSLKSDIQKREGTKVLFVDCFASTRMFALNVLIKDFDIVIYHDTHPKVFKIYGYDHVLVPLNYDSYQLSSKTSWTDMLIKSQFGSVALTDSIVIGITQFDARWGVKSGMKLRKQFIG